MRRVERPTRYVDGQLASGGGAADRAGEAMQAVRDDVGAAPGQSGHLVAQRL